MESQVIETILNFVYFFVGLAVGLFGLWQNQKYFQAQQQDKFKQISEELRRIREHQAAMAETISERAFDRERDLIRLISRPDVVESAAAQATADIKAVVTEELERAGIPDAIQRTMELEARVGKIVTESAERAAGAIDERLEELSPRQQRIYRYIREFVRENHYPPTIREIGSALGITSTSVVNYNLNKLEEAGFIERDREVSRGVKIGEDTDDVDWNAVVVPLLGTIAADQPIPVLDESTAPYSHEVIELTRDICNDAQGVYALQVKGDSMIDALIDDGDIVVMRHEETAHNGEMVAVWLKDEGRTTVKRFYHEGDRIRLQPAVPSMNPIYVDPDNIKIQGKVLAVLRGLN